MDVVITVDLMVDDGVGGVQQGTVVSDGDHAAQCVVSRGRGGVRSA